VKRVLGPQRPVTHKGSTVLRQIMEPLARKLTISGDFLSDSRQQRRTIRAQVGVKDPCKREMPEISRSEVAQTSLASSMELPDSK